MIPAGYYKDIMIKSPSGDSGFGIMSYANHTAIIQSQQQQTAATQVSLFKISMSSGGDLEHAIHPNCRFSGVVVLQLSRPLHASQVVLEFVGLERHVLALKDIPKFKKTEMFSTQISLWKPVQEGANPSNVLRDGIHVYNFTCTMPNINYPQNVERQEYGFKYKLRAKIKVPVSRDHEDTIAMVEKNLYFIPLVTQPINPDPLNIVETLYFEKKNKKGKPAIELRGLVSGHQLIPGSKLKIKLSIRELSSANWTKIVARLIERTNCRDNTKATFSQPIWSIDRELLSADLVRSSVYSFFISDECTDNKGGAKSTGNGVVSNETLVIPIPLIPSSPLGSDHLEFTHFIRLEIVVPSWRSNDRTVYTELPVQLMTCDPHHAIVALNKQRSMVNLNQASQFPDRASSTFSGSTQATYNTSVALPNALHKSPSMTFENRNTLANSLPSTFHEIHPVQRPNPVLALVKQSNFSGAPEEPTLPASFNQGSVRVMKLTRVNRGPSIASAQLSERSFETSSSHSSSCHATSQDEEDRYKTRPLPLAPSALNIPPPLPSTPMPTTNEPIDYYGHSGSPASPPLSQSNLQFSRNLSSSIISNTSTIITSPLHMEQPTSAAHEDMLDNDAESDDDAGYFKASLARKSIERERTNDKSLFRLRKNSSIRVSPR